MSKNKKVMSLAIRPELQEELKKLAKRKDESVSGFVGNLVEQALKCNPDDDLLVINKPMDDDIIPIILKIPVELKSDGVKLKHWMDVQTEGIVRALTKQQAV